MVTTLTNAAEPSPPSPSPLAAVHEAALRLATAPTDVIVAEVLFSVCMSTLGAAGGVFGVVEAAGLIRIIAHAGELPDTVLTALQPLPDTNPSLLVDAARQSELLWFGSLKEVAARYPALGATLAQSQLQAWCVVPLHLEQQVLGVLALVFPSSRPLASEDKLFLATVVVQAATALARLRQAQVAQLQAARMQALAEASQAFAQTGHDLQAVLSQVAQRVSELVGGACSVRLIDRDGLHLHLAALYHPDAELAAGARALLEATPQRVDEGLSVIVLSRGEPVLLPTIDQAALRASIRPVFHAHLDRWPITSMLTAPLRARIGAIGLIGLTRYAGEQPYTTADQSFLVDLADRAALAIANAQLYTSAAEATLVAERAATHTQRLQTLTASLAEALTPDEVMAIVATQVDQLVGEVSGLIGLVTGDGQALEIVQMAGYTPGDLRPWQRMPLEPGIAAADVVLSGEAQFWESRTALLERYPQLAQASIKNEAWAIVPLRAEGRTLGMLSLGFLTSRAFDPEERALLNLLAQQCATALQRTERYHAVEQARAAAEHARSAAEQAADRTARLYAVTAALAEAVTLTQVAEVIVTQGIAALDAIAGSVRQLSSDEAALVALHVVGYPSDMASQWQVIPLDAPVPRPVCAGWPRRVSRDARRERYEGSVLPGPPITIPYYRPSPRR